MKKLHFAWIEQVFTFDSEDERSAYIENQRALAERKKQAPIKVVKTFYSDSENRYGLQIRKPYNSNPMLTE